ncbi:MAG: hypothetical protein WC749_11690 [Dehalococcoidia bacterium]
MTEENTRQERREERRRKKQEKMEQHGKGIARVYKDAILKRMHRKHKS